MISEITTQNGPCRILTEFEKEIIEARARNLTCRLICNMTPQNESAIRRLSDIAEVRLVDRPHPLGIAVRDNLEAMIHFVDPDSADVSNSPHDVALVTSDRAVASNLARMVDWVWKHAKPIRRGRTKRLKRTEDADAN
jgi:hypothetical protein